MRAALWLAFTVLVLLFTFWAWSMIRPIPPPAERGSSSWFCHSATSVEDCDGQTAVARLGRANDRVELGLDEVPTQMVNAVLAAEDRRFFDHRGVHGRSVLRALVVDSARGDLSQGGSTITQQLIKNDYLNDDRSLYRKLDEASLALRIEREMSKEQILERYLNVVYLGRGATGVGAAAEAWFGRPLDQLDLGQVAFLAGLVRGPNSADPAVDPDEADRRRGTVLEAMVSEGHITTADADAARLVPVGEQVVPSGGAGGNVRGLGADIDIEYSADWARVQLERGVEEGVLGRGGLVVSSTIDVDVQSVLSAEVSRFTEPGDPAVAAVVLDRTGGVQAMVSGADFADSQLNVVLGAEGGGSGRQAGSVFKPVVLAEALRQGISTRSEFESPAEVQLDRDQGPWDVSNYEGADHGRLDLLEALEVSSNTVFAQLVGEVGAENVARLGTELGVVAPLSGVDAIALGTEEVSVLDMAVVFATFANDGVRATPHLVTSISTADGEILAEHEPDEVRVLDPEVASTVQAGLRRVVQSGTGRAAGIEGRWIVGKTGTSQDYGDAWFVGSSCDLTMAVWMGHFDNRPLLDVRGVSRVTGGSLPADLFRSVMARLDDADTTCDAAVDDGGQVTQGPQRG